MVVVGANHGVTRMTKEHVGMAIALNVPLFVVITKARIRACLHACMPACPHTCMPACPHYLQSCTTCVPVYLYYLYTCTRPRWTSAPSL